MAYRLIPIKGKEELVKEAEELKEDIPALLRIVIELLADIRREHVIERKER